MTRILLIAEHDGTTVNPSTAKCVTCASELPDAEIHVAVLAENGASLANEIAGLTSVDKVIQIDNPPIHILLPRYLRRKSSQLQTATPTSLARRRHSART